MEDNRVHELILIWRYSDENLDGLEQRILALLDTVEKETLEKAEEAAIEGMGKLICFSDPDMVINVRTAIRAALEESNAR